VLSHPHRVARAGLAALSPSAEAIAESTTEKKNPKVMRLNGSPSAGRLSTNDGPQQQSTIYNFKIPTQ
jgi:hypothetical protein